MSIALYRRFRPEAFNEVIGQEQVTVPLMAALRAGKTNHAYLFSGPRGCGKTTSARILARTLNCHANTPQSPTDTPCGACESCVELSRLGSGSLDVVEIDAASHGGVDDARDLRERVTFAPVRDRYKIVIIDEAHMVSSQGFNALLKVVEEPPPHIKFIFATTEPDKVLGTIKSRTHHYPFRLVPSEILAPYLENLASLEGATLGPGVTPLVIKAGGGSVRDSLSVLDQLIAGSVAGEVTYDRAVGLLGYTPAAMLDEAVDALGARDGASLFNVIDRVMETGNPPQRFAEDLLQRFRDLIVVSVTGDGAAAVFRDWTPDEVTAAQAQAAKFDLGTLTRLGETISTGLGTMVGATSPRLQLELLCARLLIPIGPEQLAARLANLEKTIATGAIPVVPAPSSSAATLPAPSASQVGYVAPTQAGVVEAGAAEAGGLSPRARAAARVETASQPQVPPVPVSPPASVAPAAPVPPAPISPAAPPQVVSRPESTPAPPIEPTATAAPTDATLEMLKAEWPEIVASIPSPVTKSMLASSLGPVAFTDGVLQIGFTNETMVSRIAEPKPANILNLVLSEKMGTPVTVRGIVWNGWGGAGPNPSAPEPGRVNSSPSNGAARAPKPVDESWQQADAAWLAGEAIPLKIPAADPVTQPAPTISSAPTPARVDSAATVAAAPEGAGHSAMAKLDVMPFDDVEAPPFSDSAPEGPDEPVEAVELAGTAEPAEAAEPLSAAPVNRRPTAASEDEADPDDEVADQTFLSGVPLVVEMLSGTVISEEPI